MYPVGRVIEILGALDLLVGVLDAPEMREISLSVTAETCGSETKALATVGTSLGGSDPEEWN